MEIYTCTIRSRSTQTTIGFRGPVLFGSVGGFVCTVWSRVILFLVVPHYYKSAT